MMVSQTAVLETGVDKLVSLVKERGRISLADASGELGVSADVVNEWVEMFDGHGVIGIEYDFTKPFIVERRTADKGVEHEEKELEAKKEIIVRKADVNLDIIRKQGEKLKAVHKEFENLKKQLGIDGEKLNRNLKELNEYIRLSSEASKESEARKGQFALESAQLERQFLNGRKTYHYFLSDIISDGKKLREEKTNFIAVKRRLNTFDKRMPAAKKSLKELEETASYGRKSAEMLHRDFESYSRILRNLKRMAKDMKSLHSTIYKKHRAYRKMACKALKKNERIVLRADALIANDALRKGNGLIEKDMEVVNFTDSLTKQNSELGKHFSEIIAKARALRIKPDGIDIKKSISELEKSFEKAVDKKSAFSHDFKKFISMFY